MHLINPELPLKTVIDTSVWVAACFHSRSQQILELWHAEKIIVCCTPPVLAEYRIVLHKIPPIRHKAQKILQRLEEGKATLFFSNPPRLM